MTPSIEATEVQDFKEFHLGSVRVKPTESGGFWVYARTGRGRFYAKNSSVAQSILSGQNLTKLHDAQVRLAAGTHEAVAYFRDENGRIGIPPTPNSPIPADCIRFEARTLKEIDSLSAEMTRESLRDWESSQEFTDGLNDALGDPHGDLKHRLMTSRSDKEKDVIRLMLADSDREDRNRANVSANTIFRFREFDRGNI